MFIALIGAVTAQLTLSRVHDRQLEALRPAPPAPVRAAVPAR